MAEEPELCRYVDIPLQHGSNRMLKAMKRPGTGDSNKALIRSFMEEVHNKGNLDAVEEFIHPNYIRHTNQTVGEGRDFHGPEGFRQAVALGQCGRDWRPR